MKKLALLSAAATVSAVLATPVMAQEATQEPGMIGFNSRAGALSSPALPPSR